MSGPARGLHALDETYAVMPTSIPGREPHIAGFQGLNHGRFGECRKILVA
ncbi:hypothetical protein [Aestuariivirga litoralis]|nr:hypothetical protein [Aestuariivirga litoralis]